METVEVESITTINGEMKLENMESGVYPSLADTVESPEYASAPDYPFEPIQGMQDMAMPDGNPIPPGRLFYVDFLPQFKEAGDKRKKIHPKFDGFQGLFAHVNNWVQSVPRYQPLSFEQICRPVDWTGQLTQSDTIYTSKELQGGNWICGLRMWLTPKANNDNSPPPSLGYYNAMPVSGVPKDADDFLDLESTAALTNEKLQSQPLPGRIMSILSVVMTLDSTWKPSHATVSSSGDDLYYIYEEPVRSLTFLRIIYAHGPPAMEQIGLKDFPPRVIKLPNTGKGRPYMQSLKDVLIDMCKWVNESDMKEIRVVGVDIAEAKYLNGVQYLQRETKQKATYNTGSSYFQGSSDVTVIKVPRVCYVKLPAPILDAPVSVYTTKLIVTPRIAYTDGEMISQVVGRTNAWLSLTGNPIKGVKTTRFEFGAASNEVDIEDCVFILSKKLIYFIEVLVLFLHGDYNEPDPSLLPASGKKIKSVDGTLKHGEYAKQSKSCNLL